MSSIKIRPRFKKSIKLNPADTLKRIQTYAQNPNKKIGTTILNSQIIFYILPEEQHYWSPQLSFEIREEEEQTFLSGLYGPSQKVWTLFMFIYFGFGIIALFSLLIGSVQWSLNMSPIGMWVTLVAVAAEITFYFIARAGKQLAEKQMKLLENELNSIFD